MKEKFMIGTAILIFAFGIFSGCSYEQDSIVTNSETTSETEQTEDISGDLITYGSGVMATPENIDELMKENN